MNRLAQHQLPEVESTKNAYNALTQTISEHHIQNFAIEENNILPPFLQLCDAMKKYDVGKNEKENNIAAEQALKLI